MLLSWPWLKTPLQVFAMSLNVKANVSAQQKRQKPSPKQLWNDKNCLSALPTRHIEKKRVSKPKIEDQKSESARTFHFYLAGPGRAHARTSPFRTVKNSVFWSPASRPIKNWGFGLKNAHPPQVNLYLTVVYDHALSTFGAGGFVWFFFLFILSLKNSSE